MFKTIILLTLSSLALNGGGASGCRQSRNDNKQRTQPVIEQPTPISDLKVVAEGFHSSITEAFVAVVRDDKTYHVLRKHDVNLPQVAAGFFNSNIIIAAFLGEKNTGGYSVEMSQETSGRIRVSEKAPGKGVMVPQMITSPFKVVSLTIKGTPPIELSLDETFRQRSQLYRINSGNFQFSGGFAGATQSFQLAGKLQVARLGDLITIGLAVMSNGLSQERQLKDTDGTGPGG